MSVRVFQDFGACVHTAFIDSLGAEPVVAGHLVVLSLGEAERLEDALGEAAHAEEAGPHHADHVVVARVERHLAHRRPACKELAQICLHMSLFQVHSKYVRQSFFS